MRMHGIQWRWVVAGVGFIYVSQLAVAAVVHATAAIGQLQVVQALTLAATLLSYLIGGFVVALLSPGKTVVEPGLSALVAAVLDVALPPATAAQLAAAPWLVIVMTGFLMALVGAWVGEHMATPPESPATLLVLWFGVFMVAFGGPLWLVSLGMPDWIVALLVFVFGGGAFVFLTRSE